MAISYNNVHYSQKPEKWNMREVLRMSTFLGIIGVIASFAIFYIGARILYLSPGVLQSFIFLKLAIAGHLTIFVARNRGHFWSPPSGKAPFLGCSDHKSAGNTRCSVRILYISHRMETGGFCLDLCTCGF